MAMSIISRASGIAKTVLHGDSKRGEGGGRGGEKTKITEQYWRFGESVRLVEDRVKWRWLRRHQYINDAPQTVKVKGLKIQDCRTHFCRVIFIFVQSSSKYHTHTNHMSKVPL